jgi:hypothetical protein
LITDDLEVRYTFNMKTLAPNKDGVVFIKPVDNALDFQTSRTYINLENLFDGQKALSKISLCLFFTKALSGYTC